METNDNAPPALQIPHNFTPRHYQTPLFEARDAGYRFLLYLAHRRAGKDKTAINVVAKEMLTRVGTYFYIFPTYSQGKKILWNGMDGDGFKLIHHIPKELWKRSSEQDLLIELKNGSILQIIGSDNIDSIVGTNPVGCVFSEYSLQNPQAYDFIAPILRENGGWALFVYTPRGKVNHGYDLYKLAIEHPDEWWVSRLPATKTGAIKPGELESERKRIVARYGDDAIFNQEYMVSFEGSQQGSYYGEQLKHLNNTDRITDVPWDPRYPVHTAWDLGVSDATAIWFFQVTKNSVRVLDYEEHEGEGLPFYNQILLNKPWKKYYGKHYVPHDAKQREWGGGITRIQTARKLYNLILTPLKKLSVQDGIENLRLLLPTCSFDKKNTQQGVEALSNYKKKWNEKTKTYSDKPLHDGSSHGSDSARYMAQAVAKLRGKVEEETDKRYRDRKKKEKKQPSYKKHYAR